MDTVVDYQQRFHKTKYEFFTCLMKFIAVACAILCVVVPVLTQDQSNAAWTTAMLVGRSFVVWVTTLVCFLVLGAMLWKPLRIVGGYSYAVVLSIWAVSPYQGAYSLLLLMLALLGVGLVILQLPEGEGKV
jgi:hypothetical protein